MSELVAAPKICSRCRRDLPLTAFGRRTAAADGLQNYCRQCVSDWAREHRPRRLATPPEVPVGSKWCRRCETVKAVEAFARNKTSKDGLQVHCRDCQAAVDRSRRESAGLLVRPRDVPDGQKFCRTCQQVKPLSEWSRSSRSRDGLQSRCKECTSRRQRRDHLERSYGLTEDAVDKLLAHQGGLCAICQSAPAIHIDHDHRTGAVRGMLCFRCNAALGQLGNSPDVLVRAARYLLTAAEERVPFEVVWTERLAQVVEYDGSAS